jgi:rubrerythrin
MANSQDLEALRRRIRDAGDDLDLLKACLPAAKQLESDVGAALARAPESLKEALQTLHEDAAAARQQLEDHLADEEADRLDPNWATRAAEREAQRNAEREQAMEALKQFGGGLVNMLQGLATKGAAAMKETGSALKASAAGLACAKCGAAIAGSPKFCPECGTPQARTCAAGHRLEGSPKFCPECGAKV